MAESALRNITRRQEVSAFEPSYNPFNPAFRSSVANAVSNLIGSSNIPGNEGYDRSRYSDLLSGSVDFAPGLGEAAGVGDVRRELAAGNYGNAAMLGGATMLGMLPVVGDAASKAIRGGLDMSQAARMQRAAEQGFDTSRPLYHSTNASFNAFEIPEGRFLKYGKGVYSSPSPDYSDRFIRENRDIELGYKEGANVMPLYARGKIGTEKDWEQARQEMLAEGVNPKGYDPMQKEIKRRLQEKGFDGLNMFGTEIIIYDPSNIRSINAAFDPAKRGSSNLMAGAAGGAIGLSALRGLQSDEQERKPD